MQFFQFLITKQISCLFFIFFAIKGYSQKLDTKQQKLWVEGNFITMVAFGGPTANNRGLEARKLYNNSDQKKPFALNVKWGGQLSYLINPVYSIGPFYEHMKTGLAFAYSTPSAIATTGGYYPIPIEDQHVYFYKLTSNTIGTKVQFFPSSLSSKSKHAAPRGFFCSVSPFLMWVKATELDHYVNYGLTDLNQLGKNPYQGIATVLHPASTSFSSGVKLSVGGKFIFKDKLLLNLEAEMMSPFGISKNNEDIDRYFRRAINRRLSNVNFFMFNLGVGYLIF